MMKKIKDFINWLKWEYFWFRILDNSKKRKKQ